MVHSLCSFASFSYDWFDQLHQFFEDQLIRSSSSSSCSHSTYSSMHSHRPSHLLVDFKMLGLISPLGGQDVTSWTGQRITDQEVAITLHQVFSNLPRYV